MKLVRILFFVVLLLVIAIVAVLVSTPLFNVERFIPRVEAAIESSGRYDAEISGPASLRIFPSPAISIAGISVVDKLAPGNRLDGATLNLDLALAGLIQRKITVQKLLVTDASVSINADTLAVVQSSPAASTSTPATVNPATLNPATVNPATVNDEQSDGFSLRLVDVEARNASFSISGSSVPDALQTVTITALRAQHTGGQSLGSVELSLDASIGDGAGAQATTVSARISSEGWLSLISPPEGSFAVAYTLDSSLGAASGRAQTSIASPSDVSGTIALESLDLGELAASGLVQVADSAVFTGMLSGSSAFQSFGSQLDLQGADLLLDTPLARVRFRGTATLSPLTTAILGDVDFSTPSIVTAIGAVAPDTELPPVLAQNDPSAQGTASVTIIDRQVSLDSVNATVQGAGYSIEAAGSGGYEFETPVAFLTLRGQVTDLGVLNGVSDAPLARAVIDAGGALTLDGQLNLVGQQVDIQQSQVALISPIIDFRFNGDARSAPTANGPQVTGEGDISLSVPDIARFGAAAALDNAALANLGGQADLRARAKLSSSELFLDGLEASLFGPQLNGRFAGSLATGLGQAGNVNLFGTGEGAGNSLRQVLAAFSANGNDPLPGDPASTFGAFSFRGDIDYRGDQLAVQRAKFQVDQTTADVDLSVRLPDATIARAPYIEGSISADQLNLDAYLGKSAQAATDASRAVSQSRTLESAWSTLPIDLSGLRALDANLSLRAARLRLIDQDWGQVALRAQMAQGRARVDFEPAQLFNGQTGGFIAADASGDVPALQTDLSLDSVAAEEVLKQLFRIDRIGGIADGRIQLAASGRSEAELMRSLGGQVSLNLKDGAVLGIDLDDTLRNVRNGLLTPVRGENVSTPFTRSDIEITVRNGVGRVNTLSLFAPVLQLNGAGTVDFARRELQLNLPVSLGSFGSDGSALSETLPIPLQLVGTWSDPTVRIDAEALLAIALRDPQRFVDLLPDGWGADRLLRDAQQFDQAARQQLDQIRDRAVDQARATADRLAAEAQQEAQQVINRVTNEVSGEITQQIQQLVPDQLQGIANQVIDQGQVSQQIQNQAQGVLNQLGGQINGQALEQTITQGAQEILTQPDAQRAIEDAGQQLLRGLFGN